MEREQIVERAFEHLQENRNRLGNLDYAIKLGVFQVKYFDAQAPESELENLCIGFNIVPLDRTKNAVPDVVMTHIKSVLGEKSMELGCIINI